MPIFGAAFRSAARVPTQNMLWAPVWACAAGDIVFDMCSVTRLARDTPFPLHLQYRELPSQEAS